ncbi:MAG: amino acid permease [Leptospiraceae bacterium]|nr:amino acid permease [Leptospiraceae bacterium]
MKLKRTLSLNDSVSILVSSIVGSGIFVTTGFVLLEIKNPFFVLLIWFIGGIFALAGALTYSFPAVIFPRAGGDYIYLKESYSPLVGFLSGWVAFVANLTANISFLAISFGTHLLILFPEWKNFPKSQFKLNLIDFGKFQFSITLEFGFLQVVGAILISIFTYLHIRGIKRGIFIQNLLTLIKLLGLILFVITGFLLGTKDWSNFSDNMTIPSFGDTIKGILLGIVPVSFAYLGWNSATYIAGEVQDPEKNIPKSTLIACLLVIILYLSINLLYLSSTNVENLVGKNEIGVISATSLFGSWVRPLILGFILLMFMGSISAIIFSASRVYYGMANEKLFFPSLGEIHPKFGTPYKSLLAQGIYSIILLFVNDFASLLYMITCSVFILSTITAFTPFILKIKGYTSSYKIPLFPFTPIFFILGNILLIIYLAYTYPEKATMGIFLTLLGIPVYFIFKNKFSGVKENISDS